MLSFCLTHQHSFIKYSLNNLMNPDLYSFPSLPPKMFPKAVDEENDQLICVILVIHRQFLGQLVPIHTAESCKLTYTRAKHTNTHTKKTHRMTSAAQQ